MGKSSWHRHAACRVPLRALAAACFALFFARATASSQDVPGASALPFGVDVHAFVSQGFILSRGNDFLAKSQHGSAEFSEIGLNFTKSIGDRLRLGVQLFARDLGPIGNYKPQVDWYYLDYRFWDWLGVRAGRNKIPFGLYNEYNDVDAGRTAVLLPQSVYPIQNRDFLLAQTGGELYGYIPLAILGQLEYRAYGGTIFLDRPTSSDPNVTVTAIRVPYVFGGRLMWLTPIEGLQVGGSGQALRIDTDYRLNGDLLSTFKDMKLAPADFAGNVTFALPFKLWLVSAEYAAHDFLFAAEYGRWIANTSSNFPALFPGDHIVNERYYLMGSYRIRPWLTPGAYYAGWFEDVEHRKGRANHQHDLAGTVRFDITGNWLVKLEGHLMRGTAGLDRALNANQPRAELNNTWGVILLKTTAYF